MIEDTVFSLVHEYKSLELGIGSIDKLRKALKVFLEELEMAQDPDIAYVLDMHYDVLIRVKAFLKDKHMGNAAIKRMHDAIFIDRLGMPRTKTPTAMTKLFEEFIKGITFFRHQIDPSNPVPIYHRFYEIYRGNHLICTSNISTTEKKRRRPLIERCYLERLIYDALYRTETLHFPMKGNADHTQNEGHMFRMDLTRQDYSVEVDIKYQDKYPITLTITRRKNGSVLYIEEYMHELRGGGSVISPYTGLVVCKRTLANGKVYMKTQDFGMERDWKLLRQLSKTL